MTFSMKNYHARIKGNEDVGIKEFLGSDIITVFD